MRRPALGPEEAGESRRALDGDAVGAARERGKQADGATGARRTFADRRELDRPAPGPSEDLLNFKRKIYAGANSAITQYFYNADAYFQFVEQAQKLGVTAPIVAGVMPITNYTQLMRFSEMCGAEIPRWLRLRFDRLEPGASADRGDLEIEH